MRSDIFGKRDTLKDGKEGKEGNPSASPLPSTVTGSSGSLSSPSTSSLRLSPTSSFADSSHKKEEGSKLIVGLNITLEGAKITNCDTLDVRGSVDAKIEARVLQIAEGGSFIGAAKVDIAEIRGTFSGELIVNEKLVIYSTGKLSGKIFYGKIVIEEGGQLMGEIQTFTDKNKPVEAVL